MFFPRQEKKIRQQGEQLADEGRKFVTESKNSPQRQYKVADESRNSLQKPTTCREATKYEEISQNNFV